MCGAELHALPEGVQRVAAFLQQSGHVHSPVMLDGAARTAQQAADALGVELGQIAKSIVFRRKVDDVAVIVVTSGDQRVDERKVEALVCLDGKRLGRADAQFVKAKTGFSIGGVSPVAHATPVLILVDQSLFRFDEIWAAAGHPNAVFSLTAEALVRLSGAQVMDASVEAAPQPVPSPCISVCQINPVTGMCTGCFRSLAEIAGWSQANDAEKKRIWALIDERASLA